MNRYGEPVRFDSEGRIPFPDFVIQYVGNHKMHWAYDDSDRWIMAFEVIWQNKSKRIEWVESGTPSAFELDGKEFVLELERSVTGKRLPSGHFVLWPGEIYQARLERLR